MYRTDENPPLYRWRIFDDFSSMINTGVTCRMGGHRGIPYGDFNQALHTGDDEESVIENRKILCQSQNLSFHNYTCARQTHGANIHVVTAETTGKGRENYSTSISDTDALIVLKKNIMINIHLADCVPITVFDYRKKAGALIHSGWRGTVQLITKKTIKFMINDLDCSASNMIAGIGPSIGPCCFETGEDTALKISSSFNYSHEVIRKNHNHIHADLKQANLEQILSMGIKEGIWLYILEDLKVIL